MPSPPPPPQRASSMRVVSRASGSRTRLQSTGSMIVHSDSEDEADGSETQPETLPQPAVESGPATRTRKAKEGQLRLGVGRPIAAGGSGARAVTKSVSTAKGRRGKSSRSLKPVEDTILEEEPQTSSRLPSPPIAGPSKPSRHPPQPAADAKRRSSPPVNVGYSRDEIQAVMQAQMLPLQEMVLALQTEMHEQSIAHTAEVNALTQRLNDTTADVQACRQQSATIELLSATVTQLQAELGRLRRSRSLDPPREPMSMSTPVSIPTTPPHHESSFPAPDSRHIGPPGHLEVNRRSRSGRPSPAFEYPPPPARSPSKHQRPDGSTTLGKRQRSTDSSHATGIVEAGREVDMSDDELRKVVLRPSRKRAKTEAEGVDELEQSQTLLSPIAGPSTSRLDDQTQVEEEMANEEASEDTRTGRPSRFDVFAGPEELSPSAEAVLDGDDDIFTDRDFDFFDSAAHLHGSGSGPKTSSAHASENQPFTFTFPGVSHHPITSTPAASGTISTTPDSPIVNNFPYPEPPHSPSPAPVPRATQMQRLERVGGRLDRHDAFRPFAGPSESRNPSGSSTAGTHESGINPTTLLRTPPTLSSILDLDHEGEGMRRKPSSNDIGTGLGMTTMPMRVDETPAGPVKRTMYGTELDNDTRFGDFGVEGVATGFWPGGKY
ncbi:hypothetical protein BV25DRAFT_1818823 [Artomyces pyxidatus]|uniref:Uncharacterized protein n=1 Tax=Artomyces pyxidatus TaxID=48021 RepID=A0ACB8TJ41_9AGAM|nr:hypothetical protein BV25DRAFT_1818823 [Artomyces pyxidatus]